MGANLLDGTITHVDIVMNKVDGYCKMFDPGSDSIALENINARLAVFKESGCATAQIPDFGTLLGTQ